MTTSTDPACRLHAILARDGRSAVVLRRGPSRRVQLISWWLDSDTFEEGQWFKGRIYEHRCDLSPSGERFAYFAQDFARPLGSWTAISKPPYLTALALWPKGDCWGGGALFESETTICLNHRGGAESELHPDFSLPKHMKIKPLGDYSGGGEDDPINHYRMMREGWRVEQRGHSEYSNAASAISFPYDPVEVHAKPRPGKPSVELLKITRGVGVKNGPWYQTDFAVVRRTRFRLPGKLRVPGMQTHALLYLDNCLWAEWGPNGDLLYAMDGRIYRLKAPQGAVTQDAWSSDAIELVDFRENRFAPLAPPEAATRW